MKSAAVVSTLGRWWETSRGLNILWIQLDLSLYHSAPLVLPSPRLICFCSRYIAVVSCSRIIQITDRQTFENKMGLGQDTLQVRVITWRGGMMGHFPSMLQTLLISSGWKTCTIVVPPMFSLTMGPYCLYMSSRARWYSVLLRPPNLQSNEEPNRGREGGPGMEERDLTLCDSLALAILLNTNNNTHSPSHLSPDLQSGQTGSLATRIEEMQFSNKRE